MNKIECIWAKAQFSRIHFNHDLKVVAIHLNVDDNSIAPTFRSGNIKNNKFRTLAQKLKTKFN
jgi:hypothetical protein